MTSYVHKRLSAQFRNIFTYVYSAFNIINIFQYLHSPPCNFAKHSGDSRRKNKATTPLQIKHTARLFDCNTFCCFTDFFNLRVPEWKVDNTKASWDDELQTTCARRKWSRKMVVWLRPWLKTLRSLLSSTNDLLCYFQIMLKRTRKS